MTFRKIDFASGINNEDTDLANEFRWVRGNLVRFRDGRPESVKGWTNLGPSVTGVARAIKTWRTLGEKRLVGIGTHKQLAIIQGSQLYDVTPYDEEQTGVTTPMTTVLGDETVTFNDVAHGRSVGDRVIFSNASGTVGGLTVDGEYAVATVVDADNFTFEHASQASSNDTGPATIDVDYLLSCGLQSARFGLGWGVGQWGKGTWGEPRSGSTVLLPLRQFSLDTWGEDLVACPNEGKIYLWDASVGVTTRAAVISANAPTKNRFILVSRPERHLVAFGTETTIGNTATFDAMYIQWSDIEDYTLWAPASTNTAGNWLLEGGSEIRTAIRSRVDTLIWTDSALHVMRLIGGTLVFAFDQLGENCGSIGLHSAIDVNGVAYWMSDCDFYMYDGVIRVLPCSVHSDVFGEIDLAQGQKVHVGHNKAETELVFFFQSKDSTTGEIDRAVVYNYRTFDWWLADVTFARTVWADRVVFREPIAIAPDGTVYYHETGRSANGSSLTRFIESGDFDLADGDQAAFVRRIRADFKINGGSLKIMLKSRRNSAATQTTKTKILTASSGMVGIRSRGHQMALRLESTGADDDWRMGAPRFDVTPDGRA